MHKQHYRHYYRSKYRKTRHEKMRTRVEEVGARSHNGTAAEAIKRYYRSEERYCRLVSLSGTTAVARGTTAGSLTKTTLKKIRTAITSAYELRIEKTQAC